MLNWKARRTKSIRTQLLSFRHKIAILNVAESMNIISNCFGGRSLAAEPFLTDSISQLDSEINEQGRIRR